MSADISTKPSRPCTEYNIFFQLERAYILQVLLHAQPTEIDTPNDIFHPSQPTYAGLPPLPTRYASLVLPYDWHLPGKERRRKRKHRKTHGVISFQDLSLRIARAWKEESNKDAEIKTYCSRVGKVGMTRYKAAMKEWKKKSQKKMTAAASLTQEKMNQEKDLRQMMVKMLSNESLFPQEPASVPSQKVAVSIEEIDEVFEGEILELLSGIVVEDEDILGMRAQESDSLVVRDLKQRNPSIISNVDIEDDEIIGMWNSVPDESTAAHSNHFYCDDCAQGLSDITSMPTITNNDSKAQAQDKSDLLQNKSTFGPKGWTQTLKEMQHMQSLLKEQRHKMVELENKRTVVARSA